jgi:hypothetical protein
MRRSRNRVHRPAIAPVGLEVYPAAVSGNHPGELFAACRDGKFSGHYADRRSDCPTTTRFRLHGHVRTRLAGAFHVDQGVAKLRDPVALVLAHQSHAPSQCL